MNSIPEHAVSKIVAHFSLILLSDPTCIRLDRHSSSLRRGSYLLNKVNFEGIHVQYTLVMGLNICCELMKVVSLDVDTH